MRRILGLLWRHHFFGAFFLVLLVTAVLAVRITDRQSFASSELKDAAIDRWGAPINQAMPSLRFVPSGTVFNTLSPLSWDKQRITVDAAMNYRRRGLVYFSGYDFTFAGEFTAKNDQGHDIDVVFVFPVGLEKNRVMLSGLGFEVNGAPVQAHLGEGEDTLVWTGRLAPAEQLTVRVGFRGRGLDSFIYRLDPAAPVRDFALDLSIRGGDNLDYPEGVAPATLDEARDDGSLHLAWTFDSLESGVPVGAILPSVSSWDEIISTFVLRAWAPFLLFFAAIVAMSHARRRPLAFYESYLLAAAYALFFCLVAYWAAFLPFVLAWLASLAVVGTLLGFFLRALFGRPGAVLAGALLGSALFLPTFAVILQGYTGLIYTFEALGLVAAAMVFSQRDATRALFTDTPSDLGAQHA